MDCIFCKIAHHEIPTDFICETEAYMVFKDIKPKAPVHLLIVPKKHVESIASLTEDDRLLTGNLVYAAKDAAASLGLQGYRLSCNVGREGGQIVDHLHLHLLGGWKEAQNT